MKLLSLLTALILAWLNTVCALPYPNMTLIDEIDAGAAPPGVFPNGRYESDGSDSVQTILGEQVRVTNGPVGWMGYQLGEDLEYDRPYVIEVVYPEDVPRSYLMSLMDAGGYQPGSHYAFHTGVYESETYQPVLEPDGDPNPNHNPINTVAYPLRQQFKSFWIIAWPQENWWAENGYHQFPQTHGEWTTGLWLYFINKSNDPGNNGVAIKTIRMYEVPDVESLIDPQVDNLRLSSSKMTFWTLESASRNSAMTWAQRARIAGVNTLVPHLMEWNYQHSGNHEYGYYRTQMEIGLRNVIPAARRHRMGIMPKLEYGGSPFMPTEAYAVTAHNVPYEQELTKLGHGTGLYKCVNPRSSAARDELKHMIDVVFESAGPDIDLIKGVMIRNRLALIAPSFSDADITAYEAETGNVIAETGITSSTPGHELNTPDVTPFDKKRRTLRYAFWDKKWREWGSAVSIGNNFSHPYMQWYYQNVADYLQAGEDHLKATYGNVKVLIYAPFSGEGIFKHGMTANPADFLASQEWGYQAGMSANKTYLTLTAADQHWNVREPAYLNSLKSLGGQATLIDPMYIEFGWAQFPYAKIAPSFEHGGQEYTIRSEILAVANANPRILGKSGGSSINRGSPEHWNAFAKNFYLIPDEEGTVLSETADVTVKTYSSGRVLVINKSLTSKTVNLSGSYGTLYNKITGASVNTAAITVGACSMQMFGTAAGGLPAYTVLPEPPPGPARHIVQFEDGTLGGTGGVIQDNTQPQSNGLSYSFASGTGSWIDVVINVPEAGPYNLEFRYSFPSGSRPLTITVNNVIISASEEFDPTGHWRGYRYHTVAGVQLNAGNNTLRLQPAVNSGPSMDQVEAYRQEGDLFFDAFSNGASAWSLGTSAPWSIISDAGDNAYHHSHTWTSSILNSAGNNWANYDLAFDFKFTQWNTWSSASFFTSYTNSSTYYRLSLQYDSPNKTVRLFKRSGGSEVQIGVAYTALDLDTWYTARLNKNGEALSVLLNEVPLMTVQDVTPLPAGKIALSAKKQAVRFDNVAVTSVPPPPPITLDTNSSGVQINGAWTGSTASPGFIGANYLHDSNTGKGTKSVVYTPTLPSAGNYQVFVIYASDPGRANNVPVTITHADGSSATSVNQTSGGGNWRSLGTFNFNAGTSGSVTIGTAGTTGHVIADGVRFVKD